MSATPRHAKRSRLARFAALFGPLTPGTDAPLTRVLMPGLGTVYVQVPQEKPPAADAWDSPEAMAQVLTAFRALADAGNDDSSEEEEAA